MDEGKIKKIIKESKKYAKEKGFKLNPNEQVAISIVKGLLVNEEKYGFRYCPCRRVSGNEEEDKKKICPCQFMQEEIRQEGRCFCGLFILPPIRRQPPKLRQSQNQIHQRPNKLRLGRYLLARLSADKELKILKIF